MSNRMCCVVNCSNTYKYSKDVIFYSVPNRPHERDLKERWIKAVKRLELVNNFTFILVKLNLYA